MLFAEKDRTSPTLIAKDLEKRNPKIADILQNLPSNESIAKDAMKNFPTVIGHSGLDVTGDASTPFDFVAKALASIQAIGVESVGIITTGYES